jgi:16S rRNA (cytidine1402-2'-O)-methyltransferase
MTAGPLYLIPVVLKDDMPEAVLPEGVLRVARSLAYFIVENAKTARGELKRMGHPLPMRELDIRELPTEAGPADLDALLAPLMAGVPGGLMSEAGVPAVADPGARLGRAAHDKGIRVIPLVGPSSILLALMASGLEGQRFAFHGYLPIKAPERHRRIVELEKQSRRDRATQIFIETPYRGTQLFQALLDACQPDTRLCVAVDLTSAHESIATRSVADWRAAGGPDLEKRPAVFLLLAE